MTATIVTAELRTDSLQMEVIPPGMTPLVAAPAAPEITPMHLMTLAINSGHGDIDRLERLMAMQIAWDANDAKKAYVSAMTRFKALGVEVLKRKKVQFLDVKYSHAELSDVTDAAIPALAQCGLTHRWSVDQTGRLITVTCILTHERGHSETVSMTAEPDSSGKKNAIQQVASAVSYLQRYSLMAICGLAAKGVDDDGRGGAQPRESAEQTQEHLELMKSGNDASDRGMNDQSSWWNRLSASQRSCITAVDFSRMRKHARSIDDQRGAAK